MKTFNTTIFCLASTLVGAWAQTANQNNLTNVSPPTPPQVTSSGANYNLWQWHTFEPAPNGHMVARIHSYVELASGLNYQGTNGQWLPAQAMIEPYAQGAIARRGQFQLIYDNNVNSASGVIDEQTSDGKRLVSNVVGLMYIDPATGQSVQIAEVQDSQGQLISDSQVLYTNAFSGVKADVLFEYRRDGTEQCIVLNAQPPAPEAFGLNSKTAELAVVTEFLNPPVATVTNVGRSSDDAEPDQAISWGATSLGRGRAFSLGGRDLPATVIKQYENVNGHYYLFEKVKYRDIQQALSALPLQSSNARGMRGMAARHFKFPNIPNRGRQQGHSLQAKVATGPMRRATGMIPDKGYVLDYITLNSAYTNFVFQGDTTYYLSGNLNLYGGNNVFEMGSVIKYAANASITVVPGSAITFATAPGRPVIFTAKDENAVGEAISGSTGTPSGYYANPALNLGSMGDVTLSEFRIAYANRGLSVSGASPTVYDAQFVGCGTAISDISGTVTMGNALFSNNKTNFNATSSANTVYVENGTFNNGFNLVNGSFGSTTFYLTNCAFVNMTNLSGTIAAGYNGFYNSPSVGLPAVTSSVYPLQRAGAASCYLTNGTAFENAGTTNITAGTLGLIQEKTTYVPIIYSNTTISVATTFPPAAQRDNAGSPNLGYHYDPLDYCFSGVTVTSNITFTAGTAVGWFELPGSGGPGYGFGLMNGISATFTGTVTLPCAFDRYSTVQEGGDGLWKDKGYLGGIVNMDSYVPTDPAILTMRFTRVNKPAADSNHFRDGNSGQPLAVAATDCEFLNGAGGYNLEMAFTNCLLYRAGCGDSTSERYPYQIYRDCTFHGGNLTFGHSEGGPPYWYSLLSDCAFENTSFTIDDPFGTNTTYASYNYNAFLTNAPEPPTEGTNTIAVTNFNWESSWFGNFYIPTNSPLIQKGSTTANLVGLYHFTTQTNQVPETNSIVDIGYHYVATDANGIPLDTNGDGIPDYLEDANGNGLADSGEIGWNIIGDLGLQVIISRPRNGSTLP